jgi:hypothetical protein
MNVAYVDKRKQICQPDVDSAVREDRKYLDGLSNNAVESLGNDVVLSCHTGTDAWKGNRVYHQNMIDIVSENIESLQRRDARIKKHVTTLIIASVGRK